jgi:CheY-like chemotaxis protein
MDKATQERVFEPFFTTKTKDKGTGLGLAVVYGIVRQHEGFIRLYSEPGLGTTFRIYLPIIDQKQEVKDSESVSIPAKGGTEVILIAEDDDTIRNLARRILSRAGYEVLSAADGEEAVTVYEANAARIDLLLFDAVMPKASGLEAYERIKRLRKTPIPVLFASGYNDAFNQTGIELPKQCVQMQKPYDPEELLRQIRLLLAPVAPS